MNFEVVFVLHELLDLWMKKEVFLKITAKTPSKGYGILSAEKERSHDPMENPYHI